MALRCHLNSGQEENKFGYSDKHLENELSAAREPMRPKEMTGWRGMATRCCRSDGPAFLAWFSDKQPSAIRHRAHMEPVRPPAPRSSQAPSPSAGCLRSALLD